MSSYNADKFLDKTLYLASDEPFYKHGTNDTVTSMDTGELEAPGAVAETLSRRIATTSNVIQCQRRQNASLPINRLPREVLVLIFQTLLDSCLLYRPQDGLGYCAQRAKLAAVSSSWYEYVNQAPSLWAVYTSAAPPTVREEIIKKSGILALTALITDHEREDWDDPWPSFAPHFGRCRHLFVSDSTFGLIEMLNTGSPVLEYLSIEPEGFFDTETLRWDSPMRVPNYPRLKTLKLSSTGIIQIGVNWERSFFTNLETIDLRSVAITSNLILQMVETSPNLAVLRLYGLHISLDEADESPGIPHPKLRVLDITEPQHIFVRYALPFVAGPCLRRLRFYPVPPYKDIPAYFIDKVGKLLPENGLFKVMIHLYSDFTISSGEYDGLEVSGMDLRSFRWVLDILQKTYNLVPAEVHILDIAATDYSLGNAFAFLGPYQSITHISVDTYILRKVLNIVCSKLPSDEWPLPKLSSITLECGNIGTQDLEHMSSSLSRRFAEDTQALQSITCKIVRAKWTASIVSWLIRISSGLDGCKSYIQYGDEPPKELESITEAELRAQTNSDSTSDD